MLAKYFADSMTKPGKSPVFGNPTDFGLEHEDVTFKTSDGIILSGWLVKGSKDKVIVQSHLAFNAASVKNIAPGRFPYPRAGACGAVV